jgi:hypothetical protein
MAGFPALFIGFDVSVAMVGGKHEYQQLKRKQPGSNPAFQKNKAPRVCLNSIQGSSNAGRYQSRGYGDLR